MTTTPTKSAIAAYAPRERMLLDVLDVMAITGLSRETIYAALRDPDSQFPRPRKVGQRLAKWYRPELLCWMEGLPLAEYQLTPKGQNPRREVAEAA